METLFIILVGLVATYIGGIPFGMINLAMIDISVKKQLRNGAWLAFGASVVEILEASVALFFGVFVNQWLETYQVINLIVAVVLVLVGVLFMFRKVSEEELSAKRQKTTNPKYQVGDFGKGVIVALLNPQAVPFWIFVLAFLGQNLNLEFLEAAQITPFLLGIFLGKFLILMTFGILAIRLKSRMKLCCGVVDKSLGALFILLGIIQGVKYFM